MTHQELHAPFYHERGSEVGVLCIHGLFGSPNQFRALEKALESLGYDCRGLLLPGHGGSCKDFAKTNYKHWKDHAKNEIAWMKQRYKKVYLIGHSMGSLFCIEFADEMAVDGIILINTPLKINLSLEQYTKCLEVMLTDKSMEDSFGEGDGKSVYSIDDGKWHEYVSGLPSALGIQLLKREIKQTLGSLKTPALIFQSQLDDTVSYRSIHYFAKKMCRDKSKIVVLKESSHSHFSSRDLAVKKRLIRGFIAKSS